MPMVNGKKYPYTKAGKKEAALAAARKQKKNILNKSQSSSKEDIRFKDRPGTPINKVGSSLSRFDTNSAYEKVLKKATDRLEASLQASKALGRYKEQDKRFGNPNMKPMKPTKKSSRKPTMKRTRPTGKR